MNLAAEIKRVAKLSGQFQLRSGTVSNTYFDKYQFESQPKLLHSIAERMVPLVPEGTEILVRSPYESDAYDHPLCSRQ